ncbi:MAG: hypothetical protein EAZ57_03820 [Cytophagales bacterium]|nr:MAG: hypothetical protein EAZ67_04835 [Cytophagales bacterium]TAF61339.1 MAG: hypothetical protein EAZ57_03820 [Cytophagales bacterium]
MTSSPTVNRRVALTTWLVGCLVCFLFSCEASKYNSSAINMKKTSANSFPSQVIVKLNVSSHTKRPEPYPLIPFMRFALITTTTGLQNDEMQRQILIIKHEGKMHHVPIVSIDSVFTCLRDAAAYSADKQIVMVFESEDVLFTQTAQSLRKIKGKAVATKSGAALISDSSEVFFVKNTDQWKSEELDNRLLALGTVEQITDSELLIDSEGLHKAGSSGTKNRMTIFEYEMIHDDTEAFDDSFFDEAKMNVLKSYIDYRLLISSSYKFYLEFPEDKNTKRSLIKTIPKYPDNIFNISYDKNSSEVICKSPKKFYKLVSNRGIWIEDKKNLAANKEMYHFFSYLWYLAQQPR